MKKLLLKLSGLSALALSNSIGSFLLINNSNNNLLNHSLNENNTSLFNNYYQAFNSDSIVITNQSVNDKQYYSYDLTPADFILSNKVDAKTLFIVDNDGNLQYKTGVQDQIPAQDKSTVANVKTEIEQNKKITMIKNNIDNSRSEYSKSYFNNTNWQFLQFGGTENCIDISQQPGVADNIVNSGHLNEPLGLYYISQAIINKKIDEKVGSILAQYFINQSSLANYLGTTDVNQINPLVKKIVDLLIDNNNIFKLLSNVPTGQQELYCNYSTNYIFDDQNNLIEVYYWNNKSNAVGNISYHYNQSFSSDYSTTSQTFTLLNWKHYANNWKDFTSLYPNFMANPDSSGWTSAMFLTIGYQGGMNPQQQVRDNFSSNTNKITSQEKDLVFNLHIKGYECGVEGDANLYIWGDNTNLYYKWSLSLTANSGYWVNFQFDFYKMTFLNKN